MKKPEVDDLLLGTVTALIVLAISIIVSKAIELLDFVGVMIGAVIFIIIVVGVASVVHIIGKRTHDQEINTLLMRLKEVVPSVGKDWLYSIAE